MIVVPGRTVTCPTCRRCTSVPESGLPTNFLVLNIIDRIKEEQKKVSNIENGNAYMCVPCGKSCSNADLWVCRGCSGVSVCATCACNEHMSHEMIRVDSLKELNEDLAAKWVVDMQEMIENLNKSQTSILAAHQVTESNIEQVVDYLNGPLRAWSKDTKLIKDVNTYIKSLKKLSKETDKVAKQPKNVKRGARELAVGNTPVMVPPNLEEGNHFIAKNAQFESICLKLNDLIDAFRNGLSELDMPKMDQVTSERPKRKVRKLT